MPNCFQLTRKGSTQPAVLQEVDSAICQSLGLEWDAYSWAKGWYDFIGFSLACGKDWDWLHAHILGYINGAKDESHRKYWRDMLRILHFLRENYNSDAWAEIGHRPQG